MDVRGVAGDEAPAHTKSVDAPRMDFVSGEPVNLVNIELELRVFQNLFLNLVVRDLAFSLVGVLGKHTDDPVTIFARHRKESCRPVARQTCGQHVVRKLPLELDVCYIKQTFEGAAFKSEAQAAAN